MKFLMITLLLTVASLAQAKSFTELEGRYKIKLLVFTAELDLTSSGHTTILRGNMNCAGQAEILGDTIKAPFDCNDGRSGVISIDLSKVTEYSKFKAPVTFPGLGAITCSFTKL